MAGSHSYRLLRHLGWLQDSTVACWLRRVQVLRAATSHLHRVIGCPVRVHRAPKVMVARSQRGFRQVLACCEMSLTRFHPTVSRASLSCPIQPGPVRVSTSSVACLPLVAWQKEGPQTLLLDLTLAGRLCFPVSSGEPLGPHPPAVSGPCLLPPPQLRVPLSGQGTMPHKAYGQAIGSWGHAQTRNRNGV